MITQVPFNTGEWLDNAIDEAAAASGKPRSRVKHMKMLTKALSVSHYNRIYPKFIGDERIQLTREQVIAVAKILNVQNPFETPEVLAPPGYTFYKFYGLVRADTLQDMDDSIQDGMDPVLNIRHPVYPNATPMAWKVGGDSMDKVVPDGSIAFGVDFQETSGTPLDGDLVVVEHVLDGRIERTLKRIRLTDAGIELHPESSNSKHRPMILNNIKKVDSEIRIRSLIHHSDKNHNQRQT